MSQRKNLHCSTSKRKVRSKKEPPQQIKQNSKNSLKTFWELSIDLFCTLDEKGKILEINPAWTQVLGWTRGEILGKTFMEFLHPDDIESSLKTFADKPVIDLSKKPQGLINRYRTKGGKYRIIEWFGTIQAPYGYAIGKDITEKQNRGSLLAESNRAAKIGCWSIDLIKNESWWNDQTYNIHELPIGTEISLENTIHFYTPEHQPIIKKAIENAINTGQPWDLELQITIQRKKFLWIRIVGKAIQTDNQTVGLMGTFQDINEKKTTELKLQKANERFDLAIKGANDGIWDWDIETGSVYFSNRFKELLGFKNSEFPNHFLAFELLIHPDERSENLRMIQKHLNNRKPYEFEFRLKKKNGNYTWFLIKAQAVWNKENQPIRMVGSLSSIHEKKIMTEALEKQNNLFKVVLDNMEEGVIIANKQGEFQLWNKQAEKIVGIGTTDKSQDEWSNHFGLYYPDGKTKFKTNDLPLVKAIQGETTRDVEMIFKNQSNPDGTLASVSSEPLIHENKCIGGVVMVRDLTEERKMQEELENQKAKSIQSSKMASLGEMAGGMAHEINNPLTIIRGFTSRILQNLETQSVDFKEIKRCGNKILNTTERMNKIIKGLKSFSRDGSSDDLKNERIEDIINETLEFCSERFKSHGVELTLPKNHLGTMLFCRKTEISQVLLNLLNNAFDATQGTPVRKVSIDIKKHSNHVEISVEDTGLGIPKEIREKIMQPFFTTKEVGKGTGLGLSISREIIRRHNGDFQIDPHSEKTRFIISLPTQIETKANSPKQSKKTA